MQSILNEKSISNEKPSLNENILSTIDKPNELSATHLIDTQNLSTKHIFIFVNPVSGGKRASIFTESNIQKLQLSTVDYFNILIYDIRNGVSGSKPGFQLLKYITDSYKKKVESKKLNKTDSTDSSSANYFDGVFVFVAGGDGTLIWCINEYDAHNINTDYIATAMIPYGTGNDFARSFGWSHLYDLHPFDNSCLGLKTLIFDLFSSKIHYHDIWNINIFFNHNGNINKINNTTRRKETVELETVNTFDIVSENDNALDSFTQKFLKFSTLMSNYFSIGIESRIGLGFEKHRTNSRFFNKLCYGSEGFKKLFKPKHQIDKLIKNFENQNFDLNKSNTNNIFSQEIPNCQSLLCLNISDFASGLKVWKHAKYEKNVNSYDPLLSTRKQKTGDKIIEFVFFRNLFKLGIERMISGQATRFAQGKGPFIFTFNRATEKNNHDTKGYCQIDGEYYRTINVVRIEIFHNRQIKVIKSASGNQKKNNITSTTLY